MQGESSIVVSGGAGQHAGAEVLTEILNKGNIAQGWQTGNKLQPFYNQITYTYVENILILGPNLPSSKVNHQIVTSSNKRYLYAMGGRGDFPKEMYKLICTGTIDSCKWTKLNAELDRIYFVAIPIPNLANKLCN